MKERQRERERADNAKKWCMQNINNGPTHKKVKMEWHNEKCAKIEKMHTTCNFFCIPDVEGIYKNIK